MGSIPVVIRLVRPDGEAWWPGAANRWTDTHVLVHWVEDDGQAQAHADITVNCGQIALTKVADADTVSAGDPIGYTLTITNSGSGNAYGVSLTDPLPAGFVR